MTAYWSPALCQKKKITLNERERDPPLSWIAHVFHPRLLGALVQFSTLSLVSLLATVTFGPFPTSAVLRWLLRPATRRWRPQ